MIKLPPQGLKILKVFHLLIIVGWFGGGIAMNLLLYHSSALGNQSALLAAFHMIEIIDTQMVALCAMATLVVGLIYGIFTNWGFFKHPWIILKWIITIFVIYSGIAYTSTYMETMPAMVEQFGIAALQSSEYLAIAKANLRLGMVQLSLLTLAFVLSIWKKPGRKKKSPAVNC